MKKLDLTSLFDHIYIEGFALFFLILSIYHHIFIIIFIIYLICLRKDLNMIKLCVMISFIGLCFLLTQNDKTSMHDQLKVINIEYFDEYHRVTVRKGLFKYHIYEYKDSYQLGDIYVINADIKTYDEPTNPFDFNSKLYFKSKGVYGYLDVKDQTYIKKTFSLYTFRDQWLQKDHHMMVDALIFGQSLDNDEVKDAFTALDIAFILNVSGLHVYALMLLIKKITFDFNINDPYLHVIIIFCYSTILYLSAGDISILRLLVMYLLIMLSKKQEWQIASINIYIIGFLLCIVFNIHLIYSYAFLMVFLIIMTLQLTSYLYASYHPWMKRYVIAIMIWIVLLPLQNHISILYICISPLIVSIFCYVIYPLAWLSLISSRFTSLLDKVSSLTICCIDLLQDYQITIWFHRLNVYMICIAYVLLICFALSKTNIRRLVFVLLFVLSLYIPSISFHYIEEDIFYMVDVGQGDGMYVKIGQTHIVIDAFEHMTSFLSHHGINDLDYLILTHSDQDHTKEAHKIIDTFNVKQIIINAYDQEYEKYAHNLMRVKAGDYIWIDQQKVMFYNPIIDYGNANNNSLVFKLHIGSYDFLFTGDIEEEAEQLIVQTYKEAIKSDVLKVAHHGSITSSTTQFLDIVDPQKAIISVGRNNRFGFPHTEIIDRLNHRQIEIYRTDKDGAIYYYQNRKREKWMTYL